MQLTEGVKATVYPAGLRHVREFAKELLVLFSSAQEFLPKDGEETSAVGARVMAAIGPEGAEALVRLVGSCVVFDPPEVTLEDLPHYLLPGILGAWVEENLAGGKWQGWVSTIEATSSAVTGKKVSISELLSSSSSPSATPVPTSSTPSNQGSRTKAGASRR